MYHRVFAFDFDGTLAENGLVPATMQLALKQLHAAGYVPFLVTGRRCASLDLGPLSDLFTGIVWENGAVPSRVLDTLQAHWLDGARVDLLP